MFSGRGLRATLYPGGPSAAPVCCNGRSGLAEAARRGEEKQRGIAEEQARRARRFQYAADMNLAQQAFQEKQFLRMRSILERYRPSAESTGEDWRGFEWRHLSQLCPGEVATLRGHLGPVRCLAFSADGRRLATGSQDETVKVWDAVGGRCLLTLNGHTKAVVGVAFGPGRRLASAGFDGALRLWDAEAGRLLTTIPAAHADGAVGVAMSPDGRRLASVGRDLALRVWDVETARETFHHNFDLA